MQHILLRQKRKTLSISLQNGQLLIKSPHNLAENKIWEFVNSKQKWLDKQLLKHQENQLKIAEIGQNLDQDDFWQKNLQVVLEEKVMIWSTKMGIKNLQSQILVKKYKSKWGSCCYILKKNLQSNLNLKFCKNQKTSQLWQNKKTEYNSKTEKKLTPTFFQKIQTFMEPLWGLKTYKSENDNTKNQKNKLKLIKKQASFGKIKNQKTTPTTYPIPIISPISTQTTASISPKTCCEIPQNLKITNSEINSQNSETASKDLKKNSDFPKNFGAILTDFCTLKFNLRLGYLPDLVLDYVVVHELSHLWQPNHSTAFWQIVEAVFPDYKLAQNWLKTNGSFYLK